MKQRITIIVALAALLCGSFAVKAQNPKFRHVKTEAEKIAVDSLTKAKKSFPVWDKPAASETVQQRRDTIRDLADIIASLPDTRSELMFNQINAPWVFFGYRHLPRVSAFDLKPLAYTAPIICGDTIAVQPQPTANPWNVPLDSTMIAEQEIIEVNEEEKYEEEPSIDLSMFEELPDWLINAIRAREMQADFMYRYMLRNPESVDYAFWNLPAPVRLADEDTSLASFIRNQVVPRPVEDDAQFVDMGQRRIYWLHKVQGSLQFSQAYLSPNWYQGGNNHLALIMNAYWNVQLNQVYHPNLLLESTLQYKLGMNSTPQDKYHDYSISEDLFQWNAKAGLKAFKRWFYSFTAQFKTQLLNSYGKDSEVRRASFLSPADLTLGLGMTYDYVNKNRTLKFNAAISPISYNLKTCIDSQINPTSFGINEGHKSKSQIGSSADLTCDWTIVSNINYRSRLFLFTDYSYFLGDWENTFSFNINKFLSTQIYLHLRYDSQKGNKSKGWNHWMLKEILSFGFAYTFSTK